ncbi:MFS transporter [Actinorhabdospora filicis]|uniref:MFS transporter n=1 Tax=Actinorhabdospora filicis TaxID=1785913 RepID=A0A9W6SS13_9ACTN|nr:MFS transporter [Actinorhabdospora filicis]GLZ79691.1 MFS transporter [Actinorhabdospora filicis]
MSIATAPSPTRRWAALGALMLCVLLIDLDTTVLNVALPALSGDLGASTGALQWVLNAYTIVSAALLIPAGALADRLGRKRVLLCAVGAFGVGSGVGAYATDAGVLIAARAVMGVGAAAMLTLTMALVPALFPREQLGRAMAFASVAGLIGFPLGPVLGGFLLDRFWWGSVLVINVPLAVAVLAACAVAIPPDAGGRTPPPRAVPTALLVAGLAALTYGVIAVPERGWGDPLVLAALGGGAVLLALFTRGQLRARAPMVDLRLFADARFRWCTIVAVQVSLVLAGLLFAYPQYLRLTRGLDGVPTGLALLPFAAGMMAGAQIGGRVLARAGLRAAVAGGSGVLAAALAAGVFTTAASGHVFLAAWTAAAGAGMGVVMVPAITAVLETLPPDRAGAGSGLNQSLRGVGTAVGVAVLGGLLTWAAGSPRLDTGDLAGGLRAVLAVCAATAVLTGLLAARRLPGRARAGESVHDLAGTA